MQAIRLMNSQLRLLLRRMSCSDESDFSGEEVMTLLLLMLLQRISSPATVLPPIRVCARDGDYCAAAAAAGLMSTKNDGRLSSRLALRDRRTDYTRALIRSSGAGKMSRSRRQVMYRQPHTHTRALPLSCTHEGAITHETLLLFSPLLSSSLISSLASESRNEEKHSACMQPPLLRLNPKTE